MDDDLQALDRERLIAEVKKLRAGIRYRQSLDEQAPAAPVHDKEFNG
ncbi:hypothetical protein [Mesorhizobium sp. M0488]